MPKFFQTLNFRRSFLIIDTILQVLSLFLLLFLYLTNDKSGFGIGFGIIFAFLYLSIYFIIQFISIFCQVFVQRELVKIRLIYLAPFILFGLLYPLVNQIREFHNLFYSIFNVFSGNIVEYLIIIAFFYPILSIYHYFLLFKKSS